VSKAGGMLLMLLRATVRSKVALAGAILLVLLFPVLLISILVDLQGGIENPYFSFLIYLVLGPLALIAVVTVVTGVVLARRKGDRNLYNYEFLKEEFTIPGRYSRIRRFVYLSTILVSFCLFLLGVVAQTGYRYTNSTEFCGNFCHTVMSPELITYQNSPHSRVPCVACHIGKYGEGQATAKLTGLRQLYATVFDSHPRPLKTPLDSLRPSRETCEQCHRPEKFHGHKLYRFDSFLPDENNSHKQTALIMKIGSGGYQGRSAQGIHWHTSEKERLFYVTADAARREIVKVVLRGDDGSTTTFFKEGGAGKAAGRPERLMDCIDCHNRPTHVFLSPNEALDQQLLTRLIPKELPFIKQQGLAAITAEYRSREEAMEAIGGRLSAWYGTNYPELTAEQPEMVEQAIRGTRQAYAENVFPEMGIRWETYRDFIGHRHGSGCFRCHDGSFRSPDNRVISRDCNLCHVIPGEDESIAQVLRAMGEEQ